MRSGKYNTSETPWLLTMPPKKTTTKRKPKAKAAEEKPAKKAKAVAPAKAAAASSDEVVIEACKS